jgi:hypothetical protein
VTIARQRRGTTQGLPENVPIKAEHTIITSDADCE